MKKLISISLSLLMLVALLHLSIATHYCGGKETAAKISLTGKLADCGMENSEKELPIHSGTNLKNHCCSNVVTVCGTDSNWTPSYPFVSEHYQYNFQVLAIPADLSVNTCTDQILSYQNVSPPGVLMSTSVDLSGICVFRI
jgi:uncharacterized protein (UPF0333 family)